METKETGKGNAIHGPCLDFGPGLKTAIREHCWNKEEILNMDCILDNVKFPECHNCIMVVKSKGECIYY